MRAGLLLASQKYGGEVFVTGSLRFGNGCKRSLRMGIKVRNPELASLTAEKINESRNGNVSKNTTS
jgi:hypothetical protein